MPNLQNIFDDCGLNVQRYDRVHGGDINDAYCLTTSSGRFFLKVNDSANYPLMFEREANGLNLLRRNSSLIIPGVMKTGTNSDHQYLLLEWLDKGSPNKDIWEKFGQGLAAMHKKVQPYFGLNENNYIGSRHQLNDQHDNWRSFYTHCRIMPLVNSLHSSGMYSSADVNSAERFCLKIDQYFPKEPPALLHGDLWGGNYLITAAGEAAIFDPAVYYGHREMDIGMTKLFGGFDQRFYKAYNDCYSLEKGWEQRIEIAQLYPLLVHAVLFGGHYVTSSRNIFQKF